MICDLIQDILKYLNFSEPSKFGVLKLQKCEYSIECFISWKVNILEHSNKVLLKDHMKAYNPEQSLSNKRGIRYWSIQKDDFDMGLQVGWLGSLF